MRFAICNELFEGWPWERVCRFAAECGYTGLEVAPFTLAPRITEVSQRRRQELRRQAEDAALEVIGLHWLLAKTEGLYLTSPDAAVRRRTSQYLVELGRACRDLGGSLMVFGSPKQRNLLPGVSREQAHECAAETFAGCLPQLADLGVRVCMEPLSPAETDFVQSCAEAVELIERVHHPNFVLHLDVKAMSSEREPVPDLIRRYGACAGHFHANDANLQGPGFGAVDFVPIFQALRACGYQGWVSVEVFDFSLGVERLARESIAYMRRCLAAADAEA
ncbi:MAG: sugar phosphate isomerase/epimerase [Planctomycetes bacterium]|nr:sugar phosphate isomerase/epimerase [Planctomycetota bacterium]